MVQDPPTDKEETEDMKKKRIAAAWDTDCRYVWLLSYVRYKLILHWLCIYEYIDIVYDI